MASTTFVDGKPTNIETRLFINGEFVESSDKKTFSIYTPSTHELVAEVYEATVEDTNRAVAIAKEVQPAWAALSPAQRAAPLKKLAALLRQNKDEFAYLEAVSMGRPVGGYIDNIIAANKFESFAEAGYTGKGVSSLNTPGFVNMTLRQPFGVVAAIIPWNVPLVTLAGKVAPALITGNTVVLKSSEKAPLTSLKLAQLSIEAGFPPGVLNIISGHGQISGATLSAHMDVRAISFTGSTRAGSMIQTAAAQSNMKNVILELGGKSPAVIFEDADLESAAAKTANSIQWNSGQVCMANSRIYVQDTIAEKFLKLFNTAFSSIHQGDPLNPTTNHGPMADKIQFEAVRRYIALGKESGTLALGGGSKDGFVEPTIFTNVAQDAKIMQEEIFGPVVNICIFHTEEEALTKANDTEYGLYAAVFTKDINRAMRFAKGLEAGTVGVNCTSPVTGHDLSFGGWKSSGVGREGLLESINAFLEHKSVLIQIE
ncbi:Aldehyde dehydrogenase C-terminal [Penicillium concentricum]|uniref:aldehyde dehydrogenase (NAD(+)) n=1 Tax=Penicillium concentricum TaxID=293559 RepID=A0A9W9SSH0_9EURO|nr:Aldehyde dehydrogenase C-terminal [Penicillium concentricum]KAJ5383807.1 Aldehyde dehydrogenase C-terminal [Penicillium concentricum]